ncbi:hypothetical protein B0T10DRAFT_605996 [Thelonectria olida]|uniref:Uncharacterized protein n=1 Tax=Thelonectria olida TaxID=1576542 RepID=A0A9P9AR27_9HYPO|nr:hypothetical protein B0T10DRAFT_605996 [Thelonectria olida]
MLRGLAGLYHKTSHLAATNTNINLLYARQFKFNMSTSGPFTVVVHPFESETRHSCGYEIGNTKARNALVVIGGLTDGPHTVPVVRPLAKFIEQAQDLDYSIFEFRMRSSFTGFGQSNLSNDVADTSAFVKYLRGLGKEKIVLMGHSTGCQDCMEYTHYDKHGSEPVDGFILQGGISDRDTLELIMADPEPSLELAAKMIAEGKADHMMPNDMIPSVLGAPISAYRFQSLAAKGGDDDYFSADLEDEKVKTFWSRFQKPVLVLHSGDDEYVPEKVDQAASNKRYQAASSLVSPLSGLIPGASHTVDEPEAQEWFAKRVGEFLKTLN